jgi:hypothetical protein
VRTVAVRPRALAAAVLGAALVGAGARGLVTPSDRPRPAAGTTSTASPAGPVTATAFARTRGGAVAAATSDVRQGQRLLGLPTDERVTALQAMASDAAAPAYVAEQTQQLSNLDGVAARGRGPLTWDVSVLAWRLDAYTPERARVSVWRVGVLSVAGLTAPLAEWTTVVYELVWERREWRIWSESQSPGPTPLGHPSEPPSTPEQLRTALAGFTRYPGPDPL